MERWWNGNLPARDRWSAWSSRHTQVRLSAATNGHEGDSTFTNSCSWSVAPSCSSNVAADTGHPQKGKRRDAFTAKHSALGQQAGSLTRAWQAIPLTRNTPSPPHTSTVAAPLRVFGPFRLEADYIVLPGMTTGTYGFPSNIADDPVLDLAMPAPESFAHAEERRLFYVALTRARRGATLITSPQRMSPFVVELLDDPHVTVTGDSDAPVEVCSLCGQGTMVERKGRFGPFLASNHSRLTANASRKGTSWATKSVPPSGTEGGEARPTPCGRSPAGVASKPRPVAVELRLAARKPRNPTASHVGCRKASMPDV